MSAVTPGPWRACTALMPDDLDGPQGEMWLDWLGDGQPIVRIEGADGMNVAAAHDLFTFNPRNAALICAAPEMLAALRGLLDPACTNAWDLARAAIAKAEGRA